ncbi:hypothetical protein DOY81_002630 [Sarcophaga bullata]|nr:hypothetical protein DOY81_002630 [Sarcophaga bullata]
MLNITELTCRVCLQEQDTLINVYDELEDAHTNLRNLLNTCADLQIEEDDIFPKYLCEDCTRELLIASKFREKCAKSKEVFNEILIQGTHMITTDMALSNSIIEYCAEELNINEISDALIEEEEYNDRDSKIDLVVHQSTSIEQNDSVSLLKKKSTENIIDESAPFTEGVVQLDEVDTLIDEDPDGEYEESIFEMEPTKSLDAIAVETQIDLTTNVPSLYKPLVDKLKKFNLTYKCDVCGAIFKQALNLQKHLQKTHGLSHCFSCNKCEHWFSLETVYFNHMQNCNYIPKDKDNSEDAKKTKVEKIFHLNLDQSANRKCACCEKEFPTPFALRMHMRTHTGERPFQCKYCTKAFKTQSQLNVHHKRHTGQADFTCTVCQKSFYEQSNLTSHMRTHTRERPHTCTICNKTFSRVFLLQFHMRTHTGEKPFSCTYCDKSFRQATDLRSHLTIHTGQKQHVCILCGKSYIKRSHLVQHMRKHNINPSDMETNETIQYNQTESAEEISSATNNIQSFVQNPDILESFDEIIDKDNTEIHADEFC